MAIKNRFGTHAKEQVEDGEIRQETVLVLKHLPIGHSFEVWVGQWMLGVDDFTEVGDLGGERREERGGRLVR